MNLNSDIVIYYIKTNKQTRKNRKQKTNKQTRKNRKQKTNKQTRKNRKLGNQNYTTPAIVDLNVAHTKWYHSQLL
jgi:predicted membrane protein